MPAISAVVSAGELSRRFDRARASLDRELYKALQRTAEVAASYAKQTTLFQHRTFELRKSITEQVFGGFGGVSGEGFAARVSANAPYAGFLEFGTRGHMVMPRRKKALRFEVNGSVRFSRGHYVRGISPRPFMAAAKERATPLFERLVAEAFVRAFA